MLVGEVSLGTGALDRIPLTGGGVRCRLISPRLSRGAWLEWTEFTFTWFWPPALLPDFMCQTYNVTRLTNVSMLTLCTLHTSCDELHAQVRRKRGSTGALLKHRFAVLVEFGYCAVCWQAGIGT